MLQTLRGKVQPVLLNDDFPPSSAVIKTLRYTGNEIHDFAWFADKRFHVLKGRVNFLNQAGKLLPGSCLPTSSQNCGKMHWIMSIQSIVFFKTDWRLSL